MNIVPQTLRWFARTPQGWYERLNVQLTDDEKQIIETNHPKANELWQQYNQLATTKIDPPANVQQAFLINHDPHAELIIANINEKGHGSIRLKKHNQYHEISF